MINIRYHIVSITAIFLALGIGTLLGSTFLERATVDQLDKNIRSAETRIAETEAEIGRLRDLVDEAEDRDEALIAASETLLDGQLTDQRVLLVLAPGVEQATVDTVRQILVGADADLRGTLTLRDGLAFTDGVDGDLAETLGLDEDDPVSVRAEVSERLVEALVAAGAPAEEEAEGEEPGGEEPGAGTTTTAPDGGGTTSTTAPDDPSTTTDSTTTAPGDGDPGDGDPGGEEPGGEEPGQTTPDGQQPEILTALLEADLVTVEPGPAARPEDPLLEQTGYRYVFVTQPELDLAADQLLLDLLPTEETDPPLPAVVVSRSVPEPAEGEEEPPPSAVAQVRANADRRALYDTVDDIETWMGLTSMVTVLRAYDGTAVGHYGQGEDRTALAPTGR